MNIKKGKKILIINVIVFIFLTLISLSYAYFPFLIKGTSKNISTKMGSLKLLYEDSEININDIFPGDVIEKTISVSNVGSESVSYNIVWSNLKNTFIDDELVIEAECERINSEGIVDGTCENISKMPIRNNLIKANINIDSGFTNKYYIKITFIDTGKPQNYNKGATFSGKIQLRESLNEPVYCTYEGELTNATVYTNGQYTYRYNTEPVRYNNNFFYLDADFEGWSVQLTDLNSTEDVTGQICSYINNIPIVSTKYMYYLSKTSTININNFNTSNVTDMSDMFANSDVKVINGLESFDTSNVTNMSSMFFNSKVNVLDLSNFNTSMVTDMSSMFYNSFSELIDVSKFNTNKVTNMSGMFAYSKAKLLDVSNFDTSNVTDMGFMFGSSLANKLDVSHFNTSKVTNMNYMFSFVGTDKLDLTNFDTSNVESMNYMFSNNRFESIDISSFNTSKVTSMKNMFSGNLFLNNIFVSNKFDISNVTESTDMFKDVSNLVGGSGTKYDSNYIDKTYARIDGGTSSPGYFTLKSS